MKIKVFLSVVFLAVILNVNAQIEQEIKSFTDSTALLINNGRKMVVKNLAENDLQKATDVYDYLNSEIQNAGYSAFYYLEDLYINALTHNWENMTDYMQHYTGRVNKSIYPESAEIAPALDKMVDQRIDALLADLNESGLDDESQVAVKLFLHLAAGNEADEDYNSLLKRFNNQFPDSRYNEFVDNFLPGRKTKASFSFSFGSGVVIPTGNLGDSFKPGASFNMSMDLNINRVFTSLYLHGASPKIKQPFMVTYSDGIVHYDLDESFSYFDAGLKGGYFLVRSKRIHLAPYLSISGSYLESNRYDVEDDELEYEVFKSFTYGAGVHTEFKIAEFNVPSIYMGSTRNYISFKMEGGYSISKEHYDYFRGNITYFTGALVWGMGEF